MQIQSYVRTKWEQKPKVNDNKNELSFDVNHGFISFMLNIFRSSKDCLIDHEEFCRNIFLKYINKVCINCVVNSFNNYLNIIIAYVCIHNACASARFYYYKYIQLLLKHTTRRLILVVLSFYVS